MTQAVLSTKRKKKDAGLCILAESHYAFKLSEPIDSTYGCRLQVLTNVLLFPNCLLQEVIKAALYFQLLISQS